jgi:hypothetical protein
MAGVEFVDEIRHYQVTDASVHDSRKFGGLLNKANTSADVYADSAYRSAAIEAKLKARGFLAVYTARVRVTVQADGTTVIREGHGTGEGRGTSPSEVHDIALKAAETDATKRALATFGKPFGLELYRGGKATAQQKPLTGPSGWGRFENFTGRDFGQRKRREWPRRSADCRGVC